MSTEISSSVLQIAVIISTFVVALLLLLGYKEIRLKTLSSDKVKNITDLSTLFQKGQFLRLATLLLIVVGAIDLAVIGKLSEGLLGLFSAVAGFVLGGLRDSDKPQSPTSNPAAPLSETASADGIR